MVNLYNELTNQEDVREYHVRLKAMGVYDIFQPVFHAEEFKGDMGLCGQIVKYIAYAYSRESEMVIIGADWLSNKITIAEAVGLPEEWYDLVIHLQCKGVVAAVNGYLNSQGDRVFFHLQTLKDLYVQQLYAAISMLKKSTNEIDYDQKQKCSQHADDLLVRIRSYEQEYVEMFEKLKTGINEKNGHAANRSLSVEDFAHRKPIKIG